MADRDIASKLRTMIVNQASDDEIDFFLKANNLEDDTAIQLLEQNPATEAQRAEELSGPLRKEIKKDIASAGRLATEVGLSIGAAALAPETGGMSAVVLRSLLSGAGAFSGSLLSESFDPTPEPLETAAIAGAAGAGGELAFAAGGQLLKAGASKIGRGFSRTVKPGAKRAQIILQDKGETLQLAQAVDNPLANVMQTIADSNPVGTSILSKRKGAAVEAAEESITELVDAMGQRMTPDEIGAIVQDSIGGGTKAFRAEARGKFGKVDTLLGGGDKVSLEVAGAGNIVDDTGEILIKEFLPTVPGSNQKVFVDMSKSKKLAQSLLERESKTESTAQAKGILRRHLQRGDSISFEEAQLLRSDLLAVGRTTQEQIPGRAKSISKIISKEIDGAMEDAAKNVSGDALQAWREANAFYKSGINNFNDRLVTKIARDDPGSVFSQLVKPGKATTIGKVKKIIMSSPNGDETWKMIQGQFGQETLSKATSPLTGEVSGSAILREINKFGAGREGEALSKILTPSQINKFKEFAKTLQLAENVPGAKFRLAAQVGQLGAAGNLFLGGINPGAVGILLTPPAMAKLVTSPTAINFFINGTKLARVGRIQAANRAFSAGMNALIKAGAIATTKEPSQIEREPVKQDVGADVELASNGI